MLRQIASLMEILSDNSFENIDAVNLSPSKLDNCDITSDVELRLFRFILADQEGAHENSQIHEINFESGKQHSLVYNAYI